MNGIVTGKEVAVSTTNGTLAIAKSRNASEILIGAFLNLESTAEYLMDSGKSVVIHCAGWKGTPNIEDTLYGGALAVLLSSNGFEPEGDSVIMATHLYEHCKSDLLGAAKESGHAKRLAGFGVTQDAEFCLDVDRYSGIVGRMHGDRIVKI